MPYYSSLFLPKRMDVEPTWKHKRITGEGWLSGKINVLSFEPNGSDYSHISKNINMYKKVLSNLPYGGESLGASKEDFHEYRIYCLVNTTASQLPNFHDLKDVTNIKGINFHLSLDIAFMLSSLSMNEEMYGPKCHLVGWTASKFNEGKLKDRISINFYIKGDRQILYNEIKWLLLEELHKIYPNASTCEKFCFVKKCIPEDAIFYNVVYDTPKIMPIIEAISTLSDREKKDINNAIVYAMKNGNDYYSINILRKYAAH